MFQYYYNLFQSQNYSPQTIQKIIFSGISTDAGCSQIAFLAHFCLFLSNRVYLLASSFRRQSYISIPDALRYNRMHKSNKNTPKKKIQEHSYQQLLSTYQQQLNQWMTEMKRQIRYEEQKQKITLIRPDNKQMMTTYLKYLSEHMCIDRLAYTSSNLHNLQPNKKGENVTKSLMLKSGLFSLNNESLIGINILPQCLNIFSNCDGDIQEQVIIRLLIYSNGFLPLNSKIPIALTELTRSPHGELRYYSNQVSESIMLIFTVGLEKIPIFSQKKHELQKFQMNLCVTLEAIIDLRQVEGSKKDNLKKVLKNLEQKRQWSIRYSYTMDECIVDQHKKKETIDYFNFTSTNTHGDIISKVVPIPYKSIKITQTDALEYMFNYDKQLFFQHHETGRVNQKRYEDEQYGVEDVNYNQAKNYVNFISDIPNFKFRLTNQQKNVVGQNGNLIVIGRSGTGKTLLSILRLYALQFLKKQQKVYQNINEGIFDKDCVNLHIDKIYEEKNIFLTASSHLIQQIMKQYNDMHYQIQKQHKKHCKICQKHLLLETQMDDQDLGAIIERIEQRQNIKGPISQMKIESFPEFFTIKTMFNIIDSGLNRSFFSKQATQIKQKNIKMVNIYCDNIYRFYEPFEDQFHILFNERMSKYTKVQIDSYLQKDVAVQMMEVDYKFFATKIWHQISKKYFSLVKRQKNKLNASVVWAEIFSIIKGSVKAHTTHLKCLSPKMYLEQSKSLFLTYQEKNDIYHLFEEYQKYKIYNHCFDLMDVVNHVLQEILFGRYQDEKVQNMFIDQVQDLTPAMIYLLTKVTKNNNFYCGDTAQAISKGVTFKFSQIKSLYSKKYFKYNITKQSPGQEQHLTVNFRSHNRILMLANAVVSMIKQLFPKTIDVLKEERSDLIGPHNYVICNGDERIIYNLLEGPVEQYNAEEQQQKQVELMIQNINNQNQNVPLEQSSEQSEEESFKSISNQQNSDQEYEEEIKERESDDEEESQEVQFQEDQNLEKISTQSQKNEKKRMIEAKAKKTKQERKNQFKLKEAELLKRELSAQQVILVRNQEEKDKLPSFLAKQHKLTCEEVKGLEYEDIVIYNFFGSSPCIDKWSLLDNLDINQDFVSIDKFEGDLSRRVIEQGKKQENRELDEQTKIQLGFDTEMKKYRIFEIRKNNNYHKIDIKQFHEIANELKLFYTLVTRAKNTVIIFDRKVPRQLSRFFKKMNLTNFIYNNDAVLLEHGKILGYRNKQSSDRYVDKNMIWRQQGVKMLVRENYDEAIRCFQKAGDIKNVKRVQAIRIVKQSQMELHTLQNQLRNPDKLSKEEFKIKKSKLRDNQKEIYRALEQAGSLFKQIGFYSKAGEIFQKTNNFQQSLSCYEQQGNTQKIAESLFKLGFFKKALQFFIKSENIGGQVECFIQLKEWSEAFRLLKKNKDLAQQKLREDNRFKSSIKICLKELLNSLTQSQKVKNNRIFNEQFGMTKQQSKFMKDLLSNILHKNHTDRANKLAAINTSYNEFYIPHLEGGLKRLRQQYESLCKEYEMKNKMLKHFKQQHIEIINKKQENQKNIKRITEIISKLGFSVADIPCLSENSKHAIIQELQKQRKLSKQINQQFIEIQSNFNLAEQQFQEVFQRKQQFDQSKDMQILKFGLQELKQIKTQFHNQDVKTLKQLQLSKGYQKSFYYESDNDNASNFSDSFTNEDYARRVDNIFKIGLREDVIQQIIHGTEEIFDLTSTLLPIKPRLFFSQFDHRSSRTMLEQQIVKTNHQMESVLKNYRLLEQLNCHSIGSMFCDYYGLKYHIIFHVLGLFLSESNNFLQKRKIKDVVHVIENSETMKNNENQTKNEEQTLKRQQIIEGLGKQVIQSIQYKKATRECGYSESITQDIVEGLVLQGYHKNCLIFCRQQQRFTLHYLYLDYDSLLKESIQKSKSIQLKGKVSKYNYHFFPPQLSKYQELYLSLINTFSIQKIFFDHDKCTRNPIMSKALQIDDFQLNDDEIEQCKKETYSQIQHNFADNGRLKNKLKQIQKNKKDLEKQITRKSDDSQIEKKYRSSKISTFKYQINQSNQKYWNVNKKIDNRTYNYWKMDLQKVTRNKNTCSKQGAALQEKLHNYMALHKFQDRTEEEFQQIERLTNQIRLKEQKEKALAVEEGYIASKIKQIDQWIKQQQFHDSEIRRFQRQIKKLKYQIDELQNQRLIMTKQKQFQIEKLEREESHLKQTIKTWSSRQNMNEKQSLIIKKVIKQAKTRKINEENILQRQHIKQHIKHHSNLKQMKQFKFVEHLINQEITQQNVRKRIDIRQSMKVVFKYFSDDLAVRKNYQICMMIMTYLSFLFNEQFRRACLEACKYFELQFFQNRGSIEQHQIKIRAATANLNNAVRKLQVINEKLNNTSDPSTLKRLADDKKYFQQQVNTLRYIVSQEQEIMSGNGFQMMRKDTWLFIVDMLAIFSKLQIVSESSSKLVELLFGFFQCRIIKKSEVLSFLQGQYVFMRADSITKNLMEQNKMTFGYYFDNENSVILTKFSDVHTTLLEYLDKQQKKVLETLPWKRQAIETAVGLVTKDKKGKFVDKGVLGIKERRENSQQLLQAQLLLCQNKEQEKELRKYHELYSTGKLLNRARNIKKEVLEFYLSNQLKEKQSFFFAKFQIKEYYTLEKLLNNMKFFNPKLIHEVNVKLNELQKVKDQWISKERFNYQDISSELK